MEDNLHSADSEYRRDTDSFQQRKLEMPDLINGQQHGENIDGRVGGGHDDSIQAGRETAKPHAVDVPEFRHGLTLDGVANQDTDEPDDTGTAEYPDSPSYVSAGEDAPVVGKNCHLHERRCTEIGVLEGIEQLGVKSASTVGNVCHDEVSFTLSSSMTDSGSSARACRMAFSSPPV